MSKWNRTVPVMLVAMVSVAMPSAQGAETLSYVDLVQRLKNLECPAVLPEPGESCQQWSSYDRASRYDADKGKYVAWDANGDGNGIIRKENGDLVMAEMEGPGCIWRIWSAMPQKGRVRIYLDGGADEPVLDMPFSAYFDGEHEPFTRESLVYTVARGWNNYTPIPYQKSCKIVAEEGWGRYYHFTYATFPKGTSVPTFSPDLSAGDRAALDELDAYLSQCGEARPVQHPQEKSVEWANSIEPGQEAPLAVLEGPRAITALRVKPDLPEVPEDREVLRALVLEITWDNADRPAVWTPLGDFFGTAPGANEYRSLPMGITEDGWFYSYWYMPFAERAVIRVENQDDVPHKLQAEIVHAPLTQPIDKLGRFHAKWHRDTCLPPEPERSIDWTILNTDGRGRFCGVMLHVWNPRGGWWGEGDEKFHVDGEPFPSTFGTGSEDYFGYAWCTAELFTRAFHNQTLVHGNVGHVSVNRWQIVDSVPFQKSFRGYIEKYYKNSKPTLYDAVAYWYLAPNGTDPYGEVPMDERMVWPEPEIPIVKGAIEGERMDVVASTAGNVRPQELAGFGDDWSNLSHLWWTDAGIGDRLRVQLPVAELGRYKLKMQLTKAPDYGIVQLYLDGKKLGKPLDLYNPTVAATGELDMGEHEFSKGNHLLMIEITGANPQAVKSYMAGLDYVKLEPVDG